MHTFFESTRPGRRMAVGATEIELPVLYMRDDSFVGLFTADLDAILAHGLARSLAEMRVGGPEAIHLCLQGADGKTRRFMVSKYENCDQIIDEVSRLCGLPVGEVVMRGLGRLEWDRAS